jgi:hypothetical protein
LFQIEHRHFGGAGRLKEHLRKGQVSFRTTSDGYLEESVLDLRHVTKDIQNLSFGHVIAELNQDFVILNQGVPR